MSMIGADPEVFLTDKSGAIIPSCDLIGGTKAEAIPFSTGNKDYKWLEDNVALEFNWSPTSSHVDFYQRVKDLRRRAEIVLQQKGYGMNIAPSHKFNKAQLSHPKALTIGCMPDVCAYDNAKKRVVDIDSLGTHRFCGGHIHLSYDKKERIPAYAVAMLMDALVGLPSLKFDKQGLRRAHYGLAGLYREKDYGVEYRTMSNWWFGVADEPLAYMACTVLSLGKSIERAPLELSNLFATIPFKDVQTAINNEDVKLAREVNQYIRWSKPARKCALDFTFHDLAGI
jgi:hypothetical protein